MYHYKYDDVTGMSFRNDGKSKQATENDGSEYSFTGKEIFGRREKKWVQEVNSCDIAGRTTESGYHSEMT